MIQIRSDDLFAQNFSKLENSYRLFKLDFISVLPDLRSGGGFTLVCWLDLKDSKNKVQSIIINGMSKVSGSLDEEDAEDITKGTVYICIRYHLRIFQQLPH